MENRSNSIVFVSKSKLAKMFSPWDRGSISWVSEESPALEQLISSSIDHGIEQILDYREGEDEEKEFLVKMSLSKEAKWVPMDVLTRKGNEVRWAIETFMAKSKGTKKKKENPQQKFLSKKRTRRDDENASPVPQHMRRGRIHRTSPGKVTEKDLMGAKRGAACVEEHLSFIFFI